MPDIYNSCLQFIEPYPRLKRGMDSKLVVPIDFSFSVILPIITHTLRLIKNALFSIASIFTFKI